MAGIFTINPFGSIIAMRLCIIMLVAALIIWLVAVIMTRVLKKSDKDNFPLSVSIRKGFIWGICVGLIIFAVYFGIFVTVNEWQYYVWDEWRSSLASNIYYMLLPEIILFITLNIFLFVEIHKLSNLKNNL